MMGGLIAQCGYCQSLFLYMFIMQVLYVMHIGIIGFLYHDMGVVMGIPSHNIDFKGAMYVLHFEFLFNDECLENCLV